MGLKHKVIIWLARSDGDKAMVIKSGSRMMRSKLLNLLFGEKVGVFVLTPGSTVETVEIHEVSTGGDECAENTQSD